MLLTNPLAAHFQTFVLVDYDTLSLMDNMLHTEYFIYLSPPLSEEKREGESNFQIYEGQRDTEASDSK